MYRGCEETRAPRRRRQESQAQRQRQRRSRRCVRGGKRGGDPQVPRRSAPPSPQLKGPAALEPEAEYDGNGVTGVTGQVLPAYTVALTRFDELADIVDQTLAARSAVLSRYESKHASAIADIHGQKSLRPDLRTRLAALPPSTSALVRTLARNEIDDTTVETSRLRAEAEQLDSNIATYKRHVAGLNRARDELESIMDTSLADPVKLKNLDAFATNTLPARLRLDHKLTVGQFAASAPSAVTSRESTLSLDATPLHSGSTVADRQQPTEMRDQLDA